ncbi:ATP-binding cassette domain-containing protein [Dyadobacter arcticus]|uniref:ABC-type multidrug transport system ATPase subunit n=1 Tax=Dyadobacter arcticus TaxID=1078754 RepID=A0ABX0UQ60_9BACT|nr:ATP-binding cassette domain-containing protein [Dyadobacter arcticus]NIJ54553.1 ABC-type multidrug transport system ATPase subunit [Dyadobacter arcticus]
MIEIENLSYLFSKKKRLFNGLNLKLPAGKIYGLLGKNGAGKSSLIKNMAGLLFPSEGSCRVNEFIPRYRKTEFLEQLFLIPEECYLPPMSIHEFIQVYAPFYPNFSEALFFLRHSGPIKS